MEELAYERHEVDGAPNVEAYGLAAAPALCVITALRGGFGPAPDLVLSGINLGVNVGRSVLHSGTVGAVLTAAQLGRSGLAVSLQAKGDLPFATAAEAAVALLPALIDAPTRTSWNLNVPALAPGDLKVGSAVPSLGDTSDEDEDDDGALVAAGYASLTSLRGVSEDTDPAADELLRGAISHFSGVFGV